MSEMRYRLGHLSNSYEVDGNGRNAEGTGRKRHVLGNDKQKKRQSR